MTFHVSVPPKGGSIHVAADDYSVFTPAEARTIAQSLVNAAALAERREDRNAELGREDRGSADSSHAITDEGNEV